VVEGWQRPKRQRRLWCEGDSVEERKAERVLSGFAQAALTGQRREDLIGPVLPRDKDQRGSD
jgi:hypothetical protein